VSKIVARLRVTSWGRMDRRKETPDMKKTTRTATRKLQLQKETLRTLDASDLRRAGGGGLLRWLSQWLYSEGDDGGNSVVGVRG
jgi:hypothetical protein